MLSANLWPWSTVTPGSTRASVSATWSKVLWLSLRTITRQSPPKPEPGPSVRGLSTVVVDIAQHYAGLRRAREIVQFAWLSCAYSFKVYLTTQISYALDSL